MWPPRLYASIQPISTEAPRSQSPKGVGFPYPPIGDSKTTSPTVIGGLRASARRRCFLSRRQSWRDRPFHLLSQNYLPIHGGRLDTEMDDFSALEAMLSKLASGEPSPEIYGKIETLLARCWDHFLGSGEEGMYGKKLLHRAEKLSWRPPILTFSIERHGGIARGSKRAEIHTWAVDLERRTACIADRKRTQKFPAAARLDTLHWQVK